MYQLTDKVVVTGGAGFIGSHLVERLLSDNEARGEIVVFDNLHRGRLANLASCREDRRLRLVQGDVRDPAAVADAIQGARIVFHLAAQSTVMGAVKDLDYNFSTNVVGTFNVLRSAAQLGVERVVFASSREVYGEPIDLPVDEEAPLLAINSYGASKAAGEAFCRSFRREFGLRTVILRFANVYGPRDVGRVIPLWVEQASAGQDLQVYGGKQVIDFVWIEQTVDALVTAAGVEGQLQPINIGSGTGTRIVDLARRIVRLAAGPGRVRLLPARPVEVTRFVANVDRMRLLLRVEPPLDPLGYLPMLTGAAVAVAS
jgi:UDP-glucose 4-epimerase